MNRLDSSDSVISDFVYSDDDYDDRKEYSRPNDYFSDNNDYFSDDWNNTKDSDADSNKSDVNSCISETPTLRHRDRRCSDNSTHSFLRDNKEFSDIEPSDADNFFEREFGDSFQPLLRKDHALSPITDPLVDDPDSANFIGSYECFPLDHLDRSNVNKSDITDDSIEILNHKHNVRVIIKSPLIAHSVSVKVFSILDEAKKDVHDNKCLFIRDSVISDFVYSDDYDERKEYSRPNDYFSDNNDYFSDDWNNTKDSDADSNKSDVNSCISETPTLRHRDRRCSDNSTQSFLHDNQEFSDIEPSNADNFFEREFDSFQRLLPEDHALSPITDPLVDDPDSANFIGSYECFPLDHLDRSNIDKSDITDESIEILSHKHNVRVIIKSPLIAHPVSVKVSSILDKSKDDHDNKCLFIRLLQFLLILLLFTGVDFSLRVASNVDYNKDPSIMSTYCYRAMVIKIEIEHKFSQTSVDDSGFLIKTWNYLTAQMTQDEIYQAKMKNFQAYKAYREKNIKFETDQIWVLFVMAAIIFIFIAAVIYGELSTEPVFVTVSWIFFCLSMASIIFIFIHICRLRYDPIKLDDCPTFNHVVKLFV
uniref:Odorant receptor n=1 Tax=Panagrolaimus sp. JU765 TaxID=591449 RepID=A0AC34RQ80_9BILA